MKFYETGRLALFDISTDVSEQNDLAKQQPAVLAKLDSELVKYLKDVNAQMAIPNPQYDPAKAPTSRKGGGGRNKTNKQGNQRKKDGKQ